MGFTGEHNSGGDNLTELLDWNYAVVPNVRLNLTTYTKHIWPSGGTDAFGDGGWRFQIPLQIWQGHGQMVSLGRGWLPMGVRGHRDRHTEPAMESAHVQLGLGISGQLADEFWLVDLNPEMNITRLCRREQQIPRSTPRSHPLLSV